MSIFRLSAVASKAPVKQTTAKSTRPSQQIGRLAALLLADNDMPAATIARPHVTTADFQRLNEEDDSKFYEQPRMVYHVDQGFRNKLTELYRQVLKPSWRILDICSSWDSHLPPDIPFSAVIGHGMNSHELQANTRFESEDNYFIQDLNQSAILSALATDEFDAVLCCCGVQYLTKPLSVMNEIRRILKPGGVLILSFGSACFKEKAIAGWLSRDIQQRIQLVRYYIETAGGFESIQVIEHDLLEIESDYFVALMAVKAPPAELQNLASGALGEMELLLPKNGQDVSAATLERWIAAYKESCRDAMALGIPKSALPMLPADKNLITSDDVRRCRDHLNAMIASFLSSGL